MSQQKMKYYIKAIIAFFAISTIPQANVLAQELQTSKSTITFSGTISNESSVQLISVMKKRFFKKLIITSYGGDALAGLKLAVELRKRKIAVEVNEYCISTCANYIFLGAEKKALLPNAILGFHGGVSLESIEESERSNLGRDIKQIHELEKELFKEKRFDTAFFDVSYSLTKPPSPQEYFQVEVDNIEKHRFVIINGSREAPLEEAAKLVVDSKSKGHTTKLTYHYEGLSKNKVYFPSLKTLTSYGATGITNYFYPKNIKSMQKLANEIWRELEIVGDFD